MLRRMLMLAGLFLRGNNNKFYLIKKMISNTNTLTGRGSCYFQKFWNGWHLVCPGQGGGNRLTVPAKQLLGDNGELALIQTYMRDLQDSKAQVVYYEAEAARYPESVEVKNRLIYWRSRVAALEYLISKGPAYIRKQGSKSYNTGGDLVVSIMNSMQRTNSNINNGNFFEPGNMFDSIQDTLTTNYAGIPLWGIVLLGGAAVYMFAGKKKK